MSAPEHFPVPNLLSQHNDAQTTVGDPREALMVRPPFWVQILSISFGQNFAKSSVGAFPVYEILDPPLCMSNREVFFKIFYGFCPW